MPSYLDSSLHRRPSATYNFGGTSTFGSQRQLVLHGRTGTSSYAHGGAEKHRVCARASIRGRRGLERRCSFLFRPRDAITSRRLWLTVTLHTPIAIRVVQRYIVTSHPFAIRRLCCAAVNSQHSANVGPAQTWKPQRGRSPYHQCIARPYWHSSQPILPLISPICSLLSEIE